jgi:hypothetical protein
VTPAKRLSSPIPAENSAKNAGSREKRRDGSETSTEGLMETVEGGKEPKAKKSKPTEDTSDKRGSGQPYAGTGMQIMFESE